MQIMPETGEWIAWRQGKEYDESRIFEPDYNIDLGCWLLSFLLEKYNGDVELAAAAYNAGHSAVNRWLDDPKYYDGKNLTIPYEETENYVKRLKMHMKNTNFCAKANMKRDANRVEPARRVLLKAGAVLLAVLVLFCTACGKSGSGDAIQTNLPQSAAPQTSEPVPQQGGSLKLPMPRNLNKDNLNYNPLIANNGGSTRALFACFREPYRH